MNSRKCSVCLKEKSTDDMLHKEFLPFAERWDVCKACADEILDGEMVIHGDGWIQRSLINVKMASGGLEWV